MVDGKIIGDATCDRVHFLVENQLEVLGYSPESGAWETLFHDSGDGRYWERTYPHGDWHGGGPPALITLSEEQAREKYPTLF